jgi:protein-S-isoprenylcysteine O-methyltransferase Ste14
VSNLPCYLYAPVITTTIPSDFSSSNYSAFLFQVLTMLQVTLENQTFLGCLFLCGYLSYLCFTPPHPPSKEHHEKDDLQKGIVKTAMAANFLTFMLEFGFHIILILFPELHPTICRNPDILNPALLTWSWTTTLFVGIVLVFAPIRLLSYAQLGKNFTFVLAKPSKLVTTGVYRYVQHPSYTGLFAVLAAWYWFYLRLDGVAACVLPASVVGLKGLTFIPSTLITLWVLWGISLRIMVEEEMMKKEFGKDWVDWHHNTKRLIPGVF